LDIRDAWEQSLSRDGHVRDPAQASVVATLGRLQQQLEGANSASRGWLAKFLGAPTKPVRGLYLWGGVGRGKTHLMDMFFDNLSIAGKQRIHFHRMMRDVHARLADLADVRDPLDQVAADIAATTRVLCFDEFFVSDIADAMILGKLLDGLFQRGVTLVTTSNSRPDDLYKNGLQRSRFLPAIALLNKHTEVVNMDAGTDYRLRLLQEAGTYFSPDDREALARLTHLFDASASSQIEEQHALAVNGREIVARRCAKGIAWFEFDAICDGPRSQADYIELSRWYPEVIVSGVPQFDPLREDQARRFIALVDEFYDRRVKLILSAAVPADALYKGKKLQFEFDRTVSRLIEMQSTKYLMLEHFA
jgi:cell division protein ZapE